MKSNDKNYAIMLEVLKQRISLARQRALLTVNRELLQLYWETGNSILQQQAARGWGAKVIDKLAADLKAAFPDIKGFSVRNIKYMRAFAEAWPDFLQQPAAKSQLPEIQGLTIVQADPAQSQKTPQPAVFVQEPLAQISWYHHTTLLDTVKDTRHRIFYIKKTIANGWSRNVLLQQIKSQLHLRLGTSITNFENTLPKAQSDLARETLKNPYLFDFLGLTEEIQERELEKALIQHMKKFLLELGRGFAYVGNQFNLVVEDDDYYLDLLFYNYQLHCFVVFELKVGDFKPEFAGKLNFYINTINGQIKGPEDKPSIGVLLCKTPNKTVVEYSLKGIESAMGVSEYELTRALPKKLKVGMPSIQELENEMEKVSKKPKGKS